MWAHSHRMPGAWPSKGLTGSRAGYRLVGSKSRATSGTWSPFLSSDLARNITGATFNVDGGW